MNPLVITSYDLRYVALSFALSLVGSFVALTAATRIKNANGTISLGNTVAAGVALGGIGVWGMHFIGMLAHKMDLASSYSLIETGVSLLAAISATSFALAYVAKAPKKLPRLLTAGFLLGMGVVLMHYLGMFGLKFGGYIQWNYALVGLSVLIALIAATAALWLVFNTPSLASRLAATFIMGVAVCAMHYTGMAAAEFICTTDNRVALPQGFGYLNSFELVSLVPVVTLAMAFLISMDQLFQRALGAPTR